MALSESGGLQPPFPPALLSRTPMFICVRSGEFNLNLNIIMSYTHHGEIVYPLSYDLLLLSYKPRQTDR